MAKRMEKNLNGERVKHREREKFALFMAKEFDYTPSQPPSPMGRVGLMSSGHSRGKNGGSNPSRCCCGLAQAVAVSRHGRIIMTENLRRTPIRGGGSVSRYVLRSVNAMKRLLHHVSNG
jgi:hypothetical protein